MMTFRLLAKKPLSMPMSTAAYISDISESRGRQDLFVKQSPQRLKALREHAMIESAVSSNRIEGVEVERNRIGTVVFGKRMLHDREEEEVRGYQNALKLIHETQASAQLSEKTILTLHRLTRGEIWDAGKYKEKDGDIIERLAKGGARIRFKTVSAKRVRSAMNELLDSWKIERKEKVLHPLVTLAAFNLDFLCIHPFRDGNGRVSRLLLQLQSQQLGYEVGRYVSMERLIEQNKARYYETLEMSSHGWHEGKHDPWPYMNYVLYIMKSAYREFEARFETHSHPRGEKTQRVVQAIHAAPKRFRIGEIAKECPGISVDLIRRVLKAKREARQLVCLGRGQSAQWERTKKWELGTVD